MIQMTHKMKQMKVKTQKDIKIDKATTMVALSVEVEIEETREKGKHYSLNTISLLIIISFIHTIPQKDTLNESRFKLISRIRSKVKETLTLKL